MYKFKEGDRVMAKDRGGDLKLKIGNIYTVQKTHTCNCHVLIKRGRTLGEYYSDRFKLVKEFKEKEVNKMRYFRQKKESINTKKGAIWKMDVGNLTYFTPTPSVKYGTPLRASRDVIEKQPKWFEEVFPVTPEWATAIQVKKFGFKINDSR